MIKPATANFAEAAAHLVTHIDVMMRGLDFQSEKNNLHPILETMSAVGSQPGYGARN